MLQCRSQLKHLRQQHLWPFPVQTPATFVPQLQSPLIHRAQKAIVRSDDVIQVLCRGVLLLCLRPRTLDDNVLQPQLVLCQQHADVFPQRQQAPYHHRQKLHILGGAHPRGTPVIFHQMGVYAQLKVVQVVLRTSTRVP